ncbi:MAG: nucleotidyltransferase family protein [Elstera sp.]
MSEQAVLLVGGRGTRLGALTADTPKPLLPVAGRPFLSHLVERLAAQGFRELLLLTGYLAPEFEAFRADWAGRGVTVTCRVEADPAGTGGALHLALPDLAPEFLLLNGDSLFAIDLAEFAAPPLPPGVDGRLALRAMPVADRYGTVQLDQGRIVGFQPRTPGAGPGLINGGVYRLRRDAVALPNPLPCSLEADIFPKLAAAGRLEGRVFDGYFLDIGIPADFARAQADFAPGGLAANGKSTKE